MNFVKSRILFFESMQTCRLHRIIFVVSSVTTKNNAFLPKHKIVILALNDFPLTRLALLPFKMLPNEPPPPILFFGSIIMLMNYLRVDFETLH